MTPDMNAVDETERFYREDWMTIDQWECAKMLADLMGGFHHILGRIKPCGAGIEVNVRNGGFSTYDFNKLTTAVVMAHDRMIRFDISPSGPGLLRLSFHRRHTRDGNMAARHPTIEDAIASIRARTSY